MLEAMFLFVVFSSSLHVRLVRQYTYAYMYAHMLILQMCKRGCLHEQTREEIELLQQ